MTRDDRSTKISGGNTGILVPGDGATIHVKTIRFGPESPPPAVDLPPPVNDRARAVFVGRGDEMDRLAESLLPAEPTAVAITAIEGMAGVGKSYLADHFALVHEDRFGGYLVLPIDPLSPQTTESLIATLADRLKVPARMDQVRAAIRSSRALVHVENVDSPEAARTAGALMAQLKGCALVLTGRMEGIGRGFGRIIALRPFSVEEGLRQLSEELAFLESGLISDGESRRLVETLAGLPLAIHLAAGYLAAGYTPAEFLENLEATRLALEPENPAETGLSRDPQRLILASAFDLSLDVLDRRIPEGGLAFPALGLLPAAGFGISLGAAAMGLDPGPARRVLDAARKLSLVERLRTDGDGPLRWRVHPLLAAHLRGRADEDAAGERVTDWFMSRLPEPTDDDYTTWRDLNAEHPALTQWLRRMHPEQAESVVVHTQYGKLNGPWAAWAAFCEDLLETDPPPEVKSNALWLLGQSRVRLGQGDEALAAAEQQAEVERNRGADRELALARGLAADILAARGDLDEALRIRREEQLPVYERLGDVRSRAVTVGKIADIFQARGDLDEALRIRREEELPVYERLGDVRELLVGRANLALLCLKLSPPRRDEANTLLCQALADARRMNIPEANQIRMILKNNKMSCEDDEKPAPKGLLAGLKSLLGGSD